MKFNFSLAFIPKFIVWLGKASLDRDSGQPSSRKVISLMAATALSMGIAAIMIAKAVYVYSHGGDISFEIGAAAMPLCGLAGYNYFVGNQKTPQKEGGE